LAGFTDAENEMIAAVLRLAVTPTGEKRPVFSGELTGMGWTPEQVSKLLSKLVERGILKYTPPDRYEVVHQVLTTAVLAWLPKIDVKREKLLTSQKWMWGTLASACLLILLLSALAYLLNRKQKDATARYFGLETKTLASTDPELAITLARYALSVEDSPFARDSLAEAVDLSRMSLTLNGNGQIGSVAYTPDGSQLVTASADGTVDYWNAMSSGLETQPEKRLDGRLPHFHTAGINAAVLGPNGLLVTASDDGTAKIWRVLKQGSTEQLKTIRASQKDAEHEIWTAALTMDGKVLATAGESSVVRLWDTQTGRCLHELRGHTNSVVAVVFDSTGTRLVSAGMDKSAIIWDVKSGNRLQQLRGHQDRIYGVAFSPDDSEIATSSWDGSVRLWNPKTGISKELKSSSDRLWGVAYSPDNKLIASVGRDAKVHVWDRRSLDEVWTFNTSARVFTSAAFSPRSVSENLTPLC
jgi:WD40 repeat protein